MPALGHVYWRGFLRLQLVSINVDIYAATESASEIHFNQIHKPSGKRIKYQKVVPGIGEVENADIVKGYQVEPDVYVTMEPEEIEAIRLESKKTIDMVQFVRSEPDRSALFRAPVLRCAKGRGRRRRLPRDPRGAQEGRQGGPRPAHHAGPGASGCYLPRSKRRVCSSTSSAMRTS